MIMQIFAEKIADTLASLHFPWKERVSSSGTFMLLEKFDLIWTILHMNVMSYFLLFIFVMIS